jgi:tetratricopeptide (TPR) repeat protein
MKCTYNIATVLLAIFLFATSLNSQTTAGTELNLGVEAYRNARYEAAAYHFEKAVELAPANVMAHLYLATTYAERFIPGVDLPDNLHSAELAIHHYQFVLDSDTSQGNKVNSAKGIASLYFNTKKFDEAKKYNLIVSDMDPQDPDPYYTVGVIDWTQCYQPRMAERAKLGLEPPDALDPKNKDQKKACDELKAKNAALITEGIDSLKKAIDLRPDYDDAMAYLNLMYREKADLECDDIVAREADFKTADEWVDKTLAVKKAKAEKRASQPKPDSTAPNPQ